MDMNIFEKEAMIDRAEEAIIKLAKVEIHPSVLIPLVMAQGINSYCVRAAIWMLIGVNRLKLTEERTLIAM